MDETAALSDRELAPCVLVGVGITLFLVARHMGAGTIQDWIGAQIQDVANGYLNPKLTFTDLAYKYPYSVSLKNLHLTAQDPAHPGHTIDIIACSDAELALGDIPRIGKPILIEKISLTDPLISAIAVKQGSTKFVGFSDLLRNTSPDTTASTPTSAPKKLSDVFRMRLVEISNGKIVYDPRIPGTVPMSLDKINTLLNIQPTDDGWYKLDTDIARNPVFDLSVKGILNLDTFSVKGADIEVLADLGQDKLDYLPPEIQALLKQYEAKGKLKVGITGDMPVTNPMAGHIQMDVTLDRANLKIGGLRIPVDNFSLQSRFENSEVYLTMMQISSLGGTADLSGTVALNDRLDSTLRVNVAGMVPQRLLVNTALAPESEDKLNLDLDVATSLMSVLGKAPPPPRGPLATIDLRNFRISAPDPVNPGKDLDLVACHKLDVDLTKPLISGKPVTIDKIVLDSPIISAVSTSPGSLQFVGVPNFPQPESGSSPAAPSPPTQTTAIPKIADVARVGTFELNNAKIIYDPRLPDTQRMVLDNIDASLKIDPDDPGSYRLSTQIQREPAFSLDVEGGIDIDNPGLQNLTLDLQADLSQGNLDYLPPQLQLLLRHFNAKEKLNLHADASVAMTDPAKANAELNIDVQNIDLTRGDLDIPVKEFSLSAHLRDRKIVQAIKVSALDNQFAINSTTSLNSRLDTDLTLRLNGLAIEPLLASLRPHVPPAGSNTLLNAEIELQSPLMVALGAIPGAPSEPAATLTVHNFKLTTDDPISSHPMDFVACDRMAAVMTSLPGPGKPMEVRSIEIAHPTIRAIAMAPQSNQFVGFTALQNLAAIQTASAPQSDVQAPAQPAPQSAKSKLSDLFRLDTAAVTDASIYYDPRIENTTPLSLVQIAVKIHSDSPSGSAYRFSTVIPSKQDLHLEVSGRADVDSLALVPLKLDLATRVGQVSPNYHYIPPQIQVLMRPFDPVAAIHITAAGTVPLTHPMDSDISTFISVDDLMLTAGGYRFPIDAIRLPLRYTPGEVQFLEIPHSDLPSVAAFDGVVNIAGSVMLDDQLDSTLSVKTDDVLLQSILSCKIDHPTTDIIGAVKMDLELTDSPLLQILADAGPQPATGSPATTAPDVQTQGAKSSPKYMSELPASWGTADIEVTHARLAGLEVIQGISNLAKSAFSDIINAKDKEGNHTVIPKERATVICDFRRDHVLLNSIHYEGEVVAANGKGFITLQEYMDLYLTGGLFQKLGGMGAVGNWIKQASDSLLYYHVWGTPSHINYEVKRGDGKPFVEGAKKITKTAEGGLKTGFKKAGEGLDKAGSFFNGLFHKKKHQDQSQTQPADQN